MIVDLLVGVLEPLWNLGPRKAGMEPVRRVAPDIPRSEVSGGEVLYVASNAGSAPVSPTAAILGADCGKQPMQGRVGAGLIRVLGAGRYGRSSYRYQG